MVNWVVLVNGMAGSGVEFGCVVGCIIGCYLRCIVGVVVLVFGSVGLMVE